MQNIHDPEPMITPLVTSCWGKNLKQPLPPLNPHPIPPKKTHAHNKKKRKKTHQNTATPKDDT